MTASCWSLELQGNTNEAFVPLLWERFSLYLCDTVKRYHECIQMACLEKEIPHNADYHFAAHTFWKETPREESNEGRGNKSSVTLSTELE